MKKIARLLINRRITTKIALSSAIIVMLTAVVGAAGLFFVILLQARMDRTAQSSEAQSALQKLAIEIEHFSSVNDDSMRYTLNTALTEATNKMLSLGRNLTGLSSQSLVQKAILAQTDLPKRVLTAKTQRADITRISKQIATATEDIATTVSGFKDVGLMTSSQRLISEADDFRHQPSKKSAEKVTAIITELTKVASEEASSINPELAKQLINQLSELSGPVSKLQESQVAFDENLKSIRATLALAVQSISQIVGAEKTEAAADRDRALVGILGMMVAVVVVSALISFALILMVRSPIRRLTAAMARLAHGDTSIELDGAGRSDEIGDMTRAVAVFRDNAIERQKLSDAALQDQHRQIERQQRIESLISSFDSVTGDLLSSVAESGDMLLSTADNLSGIARNSAQRARSANEASLGASSNVQTVASAAEELAASIEQIGGQVANTQNVVENARNRALATNKQVAGLAEAASRIGNVVKLISNIAGQTNLLALNATIEAARAGEAGRGFSIVANEVKNLANQTAKATEDIAALIHDIQDSTAIAVEAIGEIVGTMEEINVNTSEIAQAVQQQGAATVEISSSVQQAAGGTRLVAADISELNTAVEQTSDTVDSVKLASDGMRRTAQDLRQAINGFLRDVSAA